LALCGDVSQVYDGERVSHACAAVFDGEKALLVDPSYRWFGVPHKKFTVLNDLETTADYLSQHRELRLRRIAAKLQPDSAYAHFKLAVMLALDDQRDEARQELPALARLNSTGAMTNVLGALLALHDKQFDDTIAFAQKALDQGWPAHDSTLHMLLGNAYYAQGRFTEARDELRAVLRGTPDEKIARAARRTIARINETIGSD